jgi:hypothetical protein
MGDVFADMEHIIAGKVARSRFDLRKKRPIIFAVRILCPRASSRLAMKTARQTLQKFSRSRNVMHGLPITGGLPCRRGLPARLSPLGFNPRDRIVPTLEVNAATQTNSRLPKR